MKVSLEALSIISWMKKYSKLHQYILETGSGGMNPVKNNSLGDYKVAISCNIMLSLAS